jgi:hypothetical protein
MKSEFNRFDFFTKSEMALLALKFRNENKMFEKVLMALPRQDRDCFLYKFYHAFILYKAKENKEEFIKEALTRINC